MNKKVLTITGLGVVLLTGSLVFAQTQATPKPVPDPRIDALIEQNKEILKTQAEILKQLEEVKQQLSALRRRSS